MAHVVSRTLKVAWQSVLLGLAQIWANKKRSLLTTLGIVIAVASVTAVIAALSGLKAKTRADFDELGTNRIGVYPDYRLWSRGFDPRFYPRHFKDMLQHCPSVDIVSLSFSTSDTAAYGSREIENTRIHAIEPSWHRLENRFAAIGRNISPLDNDGRLAVCVITEPVRTKLNMGKDPVNELVTLGNRVFRIIGVLEPPFKSSFDSGAGEQSMDVYVPFRTLHRPRWSVEMGALAKNPEVALEAAAEIIFFLRRTRGIEPGKPDDFRVWSNKEQLESFKQVSSMMMAIAGGIVAISLLVGGVGIMNVMLVSVSERTREIGLRKAVGARPSTVCLQFLVEAVTLCLFGGVLGLIGGELLTLAMAQIPNFPLDEAYIPLWAVGVSLAFSSVVGLVFGVVPAIRAAMLDPIEALRHE